MSSEPFLFVIVLNLLLIVNGHGHHMIRLNAGYIFIIKDLEVIITLLRNSPTDIMIHWLVGG